MFKKFKICLIALILCQKSPAATGKAINNILLNESKNIFIIGGHEVDIKDYPYQADILMFGQHHCGGAIISEKAILTAAHCVSAFHESILSVRVGSSKTTTGGSIIGIKTRNVHPEFNKLPADFDVAVLILQEKLNYSLKIKPIELQSSSTIEGEMASVSGWGRTEIGGYATKNLHAVDIEISNQEYCFFKYEEAGFKMTNRMLCAGFLKGGHDACQGDSGGPLICRNSNKLCGIVSFGKGCGLSEYPGVYTKISKVREWILKYI